MASFGHVVVSAGDARAVDVQAAGAPAQDVEGHSAFWRLADEPPGLVGRLQPRAVALPCSCGIGSGRREVVDLANEAALVESVVLAAVGSAVRIDTDNLAFCAGSPIEVL